MKENSIDISKVKNKNLVKKAKQKELYELSKGKSSNKNLEFSD